MGRPAEGSGRGLELAVEPGLEDPAVRGADEDLAGRRTGGKGLRAPGDALDEGSLEFVELACALSAGLLFAGKAGVEVEELISGGGDEGVAAGRVGEEAVDGLL